MVKIFQIDNGAELLEYSLQSSSKGAEPEWTAQVNSCESWEYEEYDTRRMVTILYAMEQRARAMEKYLRRHCGHHQGSVLDLQTLVALHKLVDTLSPARDTVSSADRVRYSQDRARYFQLHDDEGRLIGGPQAPPAAMTWSPPYTTRF
ncbi:hypothetical protein M8818_003850 [Zalaria obscura]|uniref:Uncharacterized protein n=1 Tax=Zalaria obscura TaxID=2024903 RepID=A0ACC3SFE5_9PEZI